MPTFSYKGYDFDVDHTPTAEEFQQMSAYVDTLPPKHQGQSLADQYKDIVDNLPRPAQGAIGGLEALGSMAASIPSFVEGFGRKLYTQATATGTEEERRKQAEEAAQHTFIPQVHPISEMGKVGEELLSLPVEKFIQGAGHLGAGFVEGQTFLNDPTLRNTAQVEQKYGKEGIEAGRTVGQLGAEGLLVAPVVKGAVKGSKAVLDKFKKEEATSKAAQDILKERAKKEQQASTGMPVEQTELDLGQPNQYGQRPSEFTVDENGIPIRQDASLEAQTTARQGDLFSEDNIRQQGISENIHNWENPMRETSRDYLKQHEEEEAWRQHNQQEGILHEEDLPEPDQPSQSSVEIESPQERTTYRPAGQTGFGKSQRGSIGFFGKDPFEKFADNLRKEVPDVTDEEIKQVWEKQQTNTKEKTVGKIAPSLQESLSAYKDTSKEDALAALQVSADNDRPSLGMARDVLLSRGRIGIEKVQNEGIKAALAHMIGLRDEGHIRANKVLHGEEGILRNMRKLEKFFSEGKAWEVIRQRFEGQFKSEYEYNLDKDQMKIKDQMDKLFDSIHSEMERLTGKKIKQIPNYFPSMFYGDFVSEVRDAEGRLVAYVTEKSAKDVKTATEHVLKEMGEGFKASEPKYRKELLSNSFQGKAGLAQHFDAMLDLLSSDDPVVQKAQESVQNALAKRAMDTRQTKNRMKFKKGVLGAAGQKGWKSDKQNYYAAKDVLENYVRAFEDWKSNMETSKFLNEVKDKMPDKKNSYNILQDYFDDIRATKNSQSRVIAKIDNAMSNAIGHGVGSNLTQGSRWIANSMTKLWLGFWNPAAIVQNVLQPTASISKLVDLAAYGGSKDVVSPLILGFAKSLVDGISIASNGAFKTDLTQRAKYLKDFEVIKPGLIEAKDRTKVGHVLEKNVVAGGQMVSEAFARTTTFNIFSTYLEQSGYPKVEAYELAKNLTHDYMVNYESYAKAGIIGNTGIMGEMAGRLQSYKINQFTQLANYIQTLKQTKNPAPLATALAMSVAMAGVSGMIGMDVAEGIYGLLVNMGMVDPQTRSPRQMAMDLGGATGFGIPTATSGKWLSGSLTTNLVGDMSWRNIAPIFAGAWQAGSQVPTAFKWAKDTVTGTHSVPDSEKAQLLNTLTPTVFRGRWEDRLLTDKEGRITSPFTGDVVYQKGPQDDNLLSKYTNIRSKERGETVARKALLAEQEKRIQDQVKVKVQNLEKLLDESARMGKPLDSNHVSNQFQELLDLGTDPKQTIETINKFIIKNHLGDWFEQQLASGKINLSNVSKKMRALHEKERMNGR